MWERPTDRWLRVAPPLAALAYPALVWTGPALWPPLLFLALISPAIALRSSMQLGSHAPSTARAIALFAVAGPALFSFLGGLLDFQRALPLSSVGVWIPLWLVLAALAWRAPRPTAEPPSSCPPPGRLAKAHGVVALPIVAFALAHLVNHVSGIAGGEVHLALMHALRSVYRHRLLEPVLLGCVLTQSLTGLVLVARRLSRCASPLETLQSAAGVYLAIFFASHLRAVLRARGRGVDTNWHWLIDSDVFHDPWGARLAPYYVLAILALAVHLACAVRVVAMGHGARPRSWTWLIAASIGLAAMAAALVMIGLARGG
ncbi:hypothetical protein LVJ94_27270 [Pendulispora rubella]|uniref:Uncharacterized protein n=1 Tax=Pendulispora rubella TaxID=2741070 RepID=A0ABZ2KWE2_9BACT